MLNCCPSWGRKTLTFQQLEDLIEMWYLETEDEERLFHYMAKEMTEVDRIVENNNNKCAELQSTCKELKLAHNIINCQLFDICCDLKPLEDFVCWLEKVTCWPSVYIDCQRLCLFSLLEDIFIEVNNLKTLAEEVAALEETQQLLCKLTKILSLDHRSLCGLLQRIECSECILLSITEAHQSFPSVPQTGRAIC